MPNLNKIQEKTQTKIVEVDDEKLTLVIRPNKFTPARLAEFEDAGSKGSAKEASLDLCNFFCELVVDWDLQWSEEGDKVPLDPEVINENIPFSFIFGALNALQESVGVGEGKPGR